jgi:FkbM family methyltransferase
MVDTAAPGNNAQCRLIVQPIQQQGLVVYFDRVVEPSRQIGAVAQWSIEGVCYLPGDRTTTIEIQDGDLVFPAVTILGLPSWELHTSYAEFPDSASARCRVEFDASLASERPWLNLYARFADGGRMLVAVAHLAENAARPTQAPYIATVSYESNRFRFYVADEADEIQGQHHAAGKFYELDILEHIRSACPKGGVMVDVGANVGNHAVYFDRVIGAREVVVFEPNPLARDVLLKNIFLNACRNVNTRYASYAVSDLPARYRVGPQPRNNWGGTRLTADQDGNVSAVRLDDVLGGIPVALLKIDVEGMELAVLRGAEGLVAASAPIIVIEVTPESIAEVQGWLAAHGYRIERTFSMYPKIATLIAVSSRIW